ncbi:precorrin-4 C(11)-methyltransferase [Methanopyrus sp.]
MPMTKVYFVGAGPGDPELMTLKGLRVLRRADLVIYPGSLIPRESVEEWCPNAELVDSHGKTLEELVETMVEAVEDDRTVVRLVSGDPFIYSSLYEQVLELRRRGVNYEVIPGVSSVNAAAAALGEELTKPRISQTVILTRPAGRTGKPEGESLSELAKHGCTMVIFLGAAYLERIVKSLLEGEYDEDTPAAVVYKASTPEEKVIWGTLGDIAEKAREEGINRTALIIVGDVLKEEGGRSHLYSEEYARRVRG